MLRAFRRINTTNAKCQHEVFWLFVLFGLTGRFVVFWDFINYEKLRALPQTKHTKWINENALRIPPGSRRPRQLCAALFPSMALATKTTPTPPSCRVCEAPREPQDFPTGSRRFRHGILKFPLWDPEDFAMGSKTFRHGISNISPQDLEYFHGFSYIPLGDPENLRTTYTWNVHCAGKTSRQSYQGAILPRYISMTIILCS